MFSKRNIFFSRCIFGFVGESNSDENCSSLALLWMVAVEVFGVAVDGANPRANP